MNSTQEANVTDINNTSFTWQSFLAPSGPFAISWKTFQSSVLVINVVLTPIICTIGLCGNSLGIYVLWYDCKYQKQSIFRYMLALMVLDNIYLLMGILNAVGSTIGLYDMALGSKVVIHITLFSAYFDMVIYHSTSILLIVMAIERLNALLRPLTVKDTWVHRFPHLIIAIVVTVFAGLAMPFPAGVEIFTREFGNSTYYDLRSRPEFSIFHEDWSTGETVISCVYPLLMCTFNIAIPIAYCRYLHSRRAHLTAGSSNDSQQLRITLIVLWVTVLYMLLAIPKVFLQVLIFFVNDEYDHDGIYGLTFFFYTLVGDLFARVNAANDFLVYVVVAERHRHILALICSRCCSARGDYNSFSDIFKHAAHNFRDVKSERATQSSHVSTNNINVSVLKTV